ncbi:hypothetical protein NJB18091_48400 [Mycobacterium marinum]|uniref:AAA family ATPase n=1 Tax=Mycobacterium marinum TaxID=1781 RepID=UPI0021C2DB15|nr:AAA family ATPase [Mycobacterium marinum]GJO06756.1 hypothetical protein NJB18091_48400 [Mycobacterium marinum]
MTDAPIRGISISDFRRLEGTRFLPLDAPIVLLHGHNGAGKTSVLSALELALTGDIRSMRRHDPRYTAHLPYHGREFATLSVSVAEWLSLSRPTERMTVGGNRIEGIPAFSAQAAQFYAERCYLDQVSLGQLLDLYQFREGKTDSALSRFVNELLGLEQLDALRSGLTDAEDIRRLKKLSEPLADAESQAQRATKQLAEATADLTTARETLSKSQASLAEVLGTLGLSPADAADLDVVSDLLQMNDPDEDRSSIAALRQSMTALGGRIQGLSMRPSVLRLEEVEAAVSNTTAAYRRWRDEHTPAIDAWRQDAVRVGIPSSADAETISGLLQRLNMRIVRHEELNVEMTRLQNQLGQQQSSLRVLQDQLTEAQEQAGSLAEGLAALREHALDDVCPVCDRPFGEVSPNHLTAHIDRKIKDLTNQGVALRQLREQRDATTAAVERLEQRMQEIGGQLLTENKLGDAHSQRAAAEGLLQRLEDLQPIIDTLLTLESSMREAESTAGEVAAVARDAQIVREELATAARKLNVSAPSADQPLNDAWRQLATVVEERFATVDRLASAHASAGAKLEETRRSMRRVEDLKDAVAQGAERQSMWDARVKEAKRRQAVARSVQQAASLARAEIVHRVFTESLNDVWRSVFTRLAPREYFVPTFGIPTTSKAALELTLETVHTSGATGGSPQLMLSAGNLNTAALSLFIALHLAVEPLVPCLVFDDPVQSMDEVHVTQFAALMRLLSKQHGRQIIIAVHERELFQYLALELSPAFEGDELITIELDAQPNGSGEEVRRISWTPDTAIAV